MTTINKNLQRREWKIAIQVTHLYIHSFPGFYSGVTLNERDGVAEGSAEGGLCRCDSRFMYLTEASEYFGRLLFCVLDAICGYVIVILRRKIQARQSYREFTHRHRRERKRTKVRQRPWRSKRQAYILINPIQILEYSLRRSFLLGSVLS